MKITTQLRSLAFTKHTVLLLGLGMAATAALAPACSPGGGDDGGSGADDDLGPGIDLDGEDGGGGVDPGDLVQSTCTSECSDFPATPLVDAGVTEAEVAPFAGDPNNFADGTLCVTEPTLGVGGQPGALLPANWLRPRFKWIGAAGDTVYEVRLQAEEQVNDLVAYTKNTSFAIPQEIWEKMAPNTRKPITVTIRGAGAGGVSGMRGTFQIAPVNAGGSMVFWATNSKYVGKTNSFLMSFTVGSEAVVKALDLFDLIQQTEDPEAMTSVAEGMTWENGYSIRDTASDSERKPGHQPGEIQCIGCHVSSPDGSSVLFGDDWPWNKVAANVDPEAGEIGAKPSWLTPAGEAMLRLPFQSTPTMTPTKWSEGNRLMVTSLANLSQGLFVKDDKLNEGIDGNGTWLNGGRMVWMNLASGADINPYPGSDPQTARDAREAALLAEKGFSWGEIALTGETFGSAVTPDWSHDGTRIAYTATNAPDNGHPSKSNDAVPSDIHIVPFNDGAGGNVTPLAGANDAVAKEYYPAFSSDDKYVAFNRAPSDAPYYNLNSEIYVVDSAGGTPVRLRANDPVACTGQVSPGVNNSWAKWAPDKVSAGGKTYYFLVFSSVRAYEGQFLLPDPWNPLFPNEPLEEQQKSAQLYMAAMVVDNETGEITDYPAVYLWNQNFEVVGEGELQQVQNSNLTPAWDNFKIPPPSAIR